jgi:surface protein
MPPKSSASSPTQILQQQVCEKFGWSLSYGRDDETGCWYADVVMGMSTNDRKRFTTESSFEPTRNGDKSGKAAIFQLALEGLRKEIDLWEARPVQELTQVYQEILPTLELLDSAQPATWARFWADQPKVVGIDTEGNQISPPVLVQIATPDFVILEAPKHGGSLSDDLQRLLRNDSITKVFCDNFAHKDKKCLGLELLKDNATTDGNMQKHVYSQPPVVDLESLAMDLMGPVKAPRGLGRLVTLTHPEMPCRIAKPKKATDRTKGRFSNVGRFAMIEQGKAKPLRGLHDLSEQEQRYAALDSWCTLQVHQRMQPPKPEISEWEAQDGLVLNVLFFLDLSNLVRSTRVNKRWKALCTTTIDAEYGNKQGNKQAFESNDELCDAVEKYCNALVAVRDGKNTVSMEEVACKYGYPIGRWDVSQVDDFSFVFAYMSEFNEYIGSWDVSSAVSMEYMFQYAASFNQDLSGWNTSKVGDMEGMFKGAEAFNQPLASWDTKNVFNMATMFYDAASFDQCLHVWDTSHVQDMHNMFFGASAFNQSLSGWNTSQVKDMQGMFANATSFNQSLDGWITSKVTDMSYMFVEATSFNQNVDHFDTIEVANMKCMFNGATSFNQTLNRWDTRNVENMFAMFSQAETFNKPLDSWDTSKVKDMSYMFYNAKSFNHPLDSWDTHKVKDMPYMFYKAKSFNHPLDSWNTCQVIIKKSMFDSVR